MSNFVSAHQSPRMGARRLERLIRTANLSRQALLHSTWIVLALTWCVAWPLWYGVAKHHDAVTRIEPPVVSLEHLAENGPVPAYLQLNAVPRLRHALEVTQADGAKLFYVPLVAGTHQAETVRVISLGLSPHLLDSKSPAALVPPYSLQLDAAGVPERVRREMARRGVKFAETVYLFRAIELVQGRVPNRHAASDPLIEKVIIVTGSSVSGLCFVGWMLFVFRLKRLKLLSLAACLNPELSAANQPQ
jgi:hypothetical protein